ncbi:hypothetical protein [Rhodococcus ruber]|uniref:hypothetical protein n=1 Tax=Rhodococcus ruber TaxID=1830 RepID=UPI00265E3C2E|nr:hypothetical protein [Rhodococcus ruber]MDO1481414.1 hypothetical protein [Rhodococcus ruber]
MVNLATVRAETAAALTAAGLAVTHWTTQQITPPCVVVGLGDPYLDQDGPITAAAPWCAHLVLQVIPALRGVSADIADQLDDMLGQVVLALRTADPAPGDAAPLRIDDVRVSGNDERIFIGEVSVTIPLNLKAS